METGFTFADVYDEAVARSGGEQTTAEDVIRVRRGLRLLLERWEAKGYNTWRIRKLRVRAIGGQPFIQLPACVSDVVHVVHENGGELTRIPPDSYMTIGAQNRMGSPGEYWLAREEPPKLHLHPTGNGDNLDVWYVERPAHFAVGSSDMDVPGRWLEALILGLSADLARKRPGDGGVYNEGLISRLSLEAAEAEDTAMRADRDRSRFRYRIG
jgi:hypothetical protein